MIRFLRKVFVQGILEQSFDRQLTCPIHSERSTGQKGESEDEKADVLVSHARVPSAQGKTCLGSVKAGAHSRRDWTDDSFGNNGELSGITLGRYFGVLAW